MPCLDRLSGIAHLWTAQAPGASDLQVVQPETWLRPPGTVQQAGRTGKQGGMSGLTADARGRPFLPGPARLAQGSANLWSGTKPKPDGSHHVLCHASASPRG